MTSDVWQNRIVGEGEVAAGELVAHPQNWRKHPKEQAKQLAGTLGGVGWVQRVIVNRRTGRMLDGHLRAELARTQGEATPVPVVYVDLSEDEERTVLATLDPIAGMAIADEATLAGLVRSIEDADLRDVAASVASSLNVALDSDVDPEKDTDPQIDAAEELCRKWGVEPGQLWQLGEHRLICGDCTDAAVVARVMGGEKAQILFTSPPYWVGMEYEYQGSEQDIDQFIDQCVKAWTDHVSVNFGRVIINTGSAAIHRIDKKRKVEVLPLIDKWQRSLRQRGWIARHFRIWAKSGDFPASIAPESDVVDQRWEHLITFTNDRYRYMATFWAPTGTQRGQERTNQPWAQQGVWSDIKGDRSAGGTHIAAFPLELPLRYLMLYSRNTEIVLEPFSGSGTTLIACENLGRRCRAVEIAPGYVAVALERWATHTGKVPVLVEAGG